ncbi:DNA cytosine methyltransferase [Anoxybacillus flavithermus]|uniref:DNA cytosine methyltransferase n=1 Tax=Anoxybacillus flavithermus TaxID=33934 RepID=UPI0018679DD9|nr:DNA (cytosine-5-)-methyltransferase [Anoxybacillus flavithermus]MBE2914150.1 DNA (cytosine-5-)-methyltransferase [Anoxybacillus flavithermus]
MYKVVSLFSGCGGLDYGFIKAGYDVIWANDIDKFAVKTYKENFGDHIVLGDINDIELDSIPDHDVLLAGFPCQPFSMMGNELGFEDARGTLFFRITEIVKHKIEKNRKPKVIVLENVRTLRTHDKGRTYKVIMHVLKNELGYKVFDAVLNSADYGVPQTRNRTFIVCFSDHSVNFKFPDPIPLKKTLQDLLEKNVPEKYFLSEKILKTVLSTGTKNFHAKPEIDLKIARPLCATMAKMHRACQDNYVTDNGRVRRLTPRECARLQGFPDDFKIVVSDTQAYKQFGNAVTVNVAYYIALSIMEALHGPKKLSNEELENAATY